MFTRKIFLALTLIGVMGVIQIGSALGEDQKLVGVWHVNGHRTASLNDRPFNITFNADGTMHYISTTTINNPLSPLGTVFSGRSGGVGIWKKTGPREYIFKSEEYLYDEFGNGNGRFLVDVTIQLTRGKTRADDTISQTGSFKITEFVFGDETQCASQVAGCIIGETVKAEGGDIVANGYRVTKDCFFSGPPCEDIVP